MFAIHAIRAIRAFRALGLGCVALLTPLYAQDYPGKTVTIVVPFTAGGGVDNVARLLADKLRVTLKQNVVVDNKPGASGMLGANAVAKAAPDGHTVLLGSAGETAINPHIYKGRMQYSPEKDLAPITLVSRVPNVMVVAPTLPVKNIEEFVALGKKSSKKLSYSSSGIGNVQHLNGELLEELAGIGLIHAPYKGAAGQLADVTTGVVDATFTSYAAARPFIQAGRVKVIAVTSAKRMPSTPEVPAIAEYAPLAKYRLENWFALFAPAGTPAAVQEKLNAAVVAALNDAEVAKRMREAGFEPAPMSIAQFKDFVKTESAAFARIVEVAKVVAE
ncbi:MAG: hypothetical protein RLZZ502_930 [Pseudomonadota bacterium]